MKLKEMLAGLFRKKEVDYCGNTTPDKPIREERQTKNNADPYGLGIVQWALASGDYGWDCKGFKKVTLVNVGDCKNNITVYSVASALRGTGHAEWEYLLAVNFVKQVVEALKKNLSEADISVLFSCDLTASRDRVFSQKKIYDHVIPLFKIVGETDEELRLAINI